MRYLRFVISPKHRESNVRTGLFHAARDLRESESLSSTEEATLESEVAWFSENLPKPSRFSRKRNSYHRDTRGISWFKDSAGECIRRMRAVASVLEQHGWLVETLTSEKPGYVVYEDEWQIVAEPFSDTGA